MRPAFAEQLGRFRALTQAAQPLPADLAAWVQTQLEAQVHRDYQRQQRDQHLRRAGDIAGGSLAQRVAAIEREAAALSRCWALHAQRDPEPGTVRGAVHRARLILPIPKRRRLYAILGGTVHSTA